MRSSSFLPFSAIAYRNGRQESSTAITIRKNCNTYPKINNHVSKNKKTNEKNKKRVELFLEDSANEIVKEGLNVQNQFAHDMLQGLTQDEIKVCKKVFEKICRNAEECIQKKG